MKQGTRLNHNLLGTKAQAFMDDLRKRVVGQDDAIQIVTKLYQVYCAGMSAPGKPLSSVLFLGPTGVGKTRLVEAVSEVVTGNALAVLKIDCGEFQNGHEVAKLTGAPPGYLGHKETHALLTQSRLDQHHTNTVKVSFVLFDEIEKASDSLWNLLLGILDKATLTLGDNTAVNFSRAMIFMTSNVGSREMMDLLKPFGFATKATDNSADKLATAGLAAAGKKFTPEFLNRLDHVVSFRPLSKNDLFDVFRIEMQSVENVVARSRPDLKFVLDKGVSEFLVSDGYEPKYGARHLKRSISKHILGPLSNIVASEQAAIGATITIHKARGGAGLYFTTNAQAAEVAV